MWDGRILTVLYDVGGGINSDLESNCMKISILDRIAAAGSLTPAGNLFTPKTANQ
jgi:hypothetical protein